MSNEPDESPLALPAKGAFSCADLPAAEKAQVRPARLEWRERSGGGLAPYAAEFGDIYFAEDGLAETRHVFLDGTRLDERIAQGGEVVIGETGFGAGLNFLATLDLWRRSQKPAGARLRYVSCELFPLCPADLRKSLEAFPELAPLAAELVVRHPPAEAGAFDVDFRDDVHLRLLFGEAAAALTAEPFLADAWFLDGFAPSRNPSIWREEVLRLVAARSKPGARAATFTAAGAVRRGLEAVGFEVTKRNGFGAKREMLTAIFAGGASPAAPALRPNLPPPAARKGAEPWWDPSSIKPLSPGARVAIVGAGIAGAAVADAIRRRGLTATVFDAEGPAAGASGNPAGLIMPRLDLGDGATARFFRLAYLHALDALRRLGAETGFFRRCGVILVAADAAERKRHGRLLDAKVLSSADLTAHQDGLFFPTGGVVDPSAYVRAMLAGGDVDRRRVVDVGSRGDGVSLSFADGAQAAFDACVIANGRDAAKFLALRTVPLSGVAGQIDLLPDLAPLCSAIAAGPYAAPAPCGGSVVGATYEPVGPDETPEVSAEATALNLDAARTLGVSIADGAPTIPRVAVRCQTPDRLPIVGAVPDWAYFGTWYDDLRFGRRRDYPPARHQPGVFALAGLGSRGLVTAPLSAEILAARMTGAVLPPEIDERIASALHPGRFFIRDLKRAQPRRGAN